MDGFNFGEQIACNVTIILRVVIGFLSPRKDLQ